MAHAKPTPEQVRAWYDDLASLYSQRNSEYAVLRNAFDAQFVSNAQPAAIGMGEFNDRKKLVYNLINTATRRFMDEMSAPVRISAIPRGIRDDQIKIAEKRQKALMQVMEDEKMVLKIIQAAYNQSLLDKAIWHVRPNPDKAMLVDISLVLPEAYLPLPKTDDWSEHQAVLISYRKLVLGEKTNDGSLDPLNPNTVDVQMPSDRVIEYWDDQWYCKWEAGRFTVEIEHGLGAHMFEEMHNIPIPHRHRGQGDGDQSVGLNEYLNELMSDQADVLAYLAHPIIVVRGSKVGSQNLTWGPKAIWELERDGSAEILTWQGAPPTFEAQILRTMQAIEDNTGMSAPAFGRDIPSGVSGETVRSVLAGFNTRVGTKQTLAGLSLANLFKKVQRIWEVQFPNAKIPIPGEMEGGEPAVLKPKDMMGFYGVRVIFEPQNETVRVFTELQKMEKGVQSKRTTMKNLGIVNPGDEEKRIVFERQREIAMTQAANQMIGGAGFPGQPGLPMQPGQRPLPGQPQLPGPQPFNTAQTPELGAEIAASDPNPEGFGDLLDPDAEEQPISVRQIIDLVGDEDLSGRAILAGQIVDDGETLGKFDLIVDNATDAGRVREALGPLAGRANISVRDENVEIKSPTISVGRARTPRRPNERRQSSR